jgi:hypothetical protein
MLLKIMDGKMETPLGEEWLFPGVIGTFSPEGDPMMKLTSPTLLTILAVLVSALPLNAMALEQDSAETILEQETARTAESAVTQAQDPAMLFFGEAVSNPLFVGVDDETVPTYLVDPATGSNTQAFIGTTVWGSAYDPGNDLIYIVHDSVLYSWPVGGTVTEVGTITDGAGNDRSFVSLAFFNGHLYGTRNVTNEAVYLINPATLVATIEIDYEDADYDFGGLAIDPQTGEFYGTNDDSTPYGAGLFRIDQDGTCTLIAGYPDGQTDIDGLTISDTGLAYLVTDEPGSTYVYDLSAGSFLPPFDNPWTNSEVFSGAAWIWNATDIFSDDFESGGLGAWSSSSP